MEQLDHSSRIALIDNDVSAKGLAANLEDIGFQVQWFQTARSAVQTILANPSMYSLIITDFWLEAGDFQGWEVVRLLGPSALHIPTLVMSGDAEYPRQKLKKECLPDVPVLQKPCSPEMILQVVSDSQSQVMNALESPQL